MPKQKNGAQNSFTWYAASDATVAASPVFTFPSAVGAFSATFHGLIAFKNAGLSRACRYYGRASCTNGVVTRLGEVVLEKQDINGLVLTIPVVNLGSGQFTLAVTVASLDNTPFKVACSTTFCCIQKTDWTKANITVNSLITNTGLNYFAYRGMMAGTYPVANYTLSLGTYESVGNKVIAIEGAYSSIQRSDMNVWTGRFVVNINIVNGAYVYAGITLYEKTGAVNIFQLQVYEVTSTKFEIVLLAAAADSFQFYTTGHLQAVVLDTTNDTYSGLTLA